MSDPAQEPSEPEIAPESEPEPEAGPAPERAQPQEASLEDLVAALGRPRNRGDEPEEEDEDEVADPEPDPFAEYSDLDLATSLPIDPDDDLSKVEGEASPRLMSIIESLLFAADKPMTVKLIRRLLKEPTKRQIQLSLKQLIFDTQHRGVVLGQVAGGFRLRTHPDNAPFVQKMMAGKPVRLSRSQLESLAVVAYRQPVTKAELDHIRGVDCGAVLRVLLERDLAKIVGRKEEAGRPHLYGTTVAFLEFFNLKGLRDLPDLHEFKELSEESEATLRHTVQSGSLSDEQEAMGQSRIEFPDAQAGATAEDGPAADGPAPTPEGGMEGIGEATSRDSDAPDTDPDASSDTVAAPLNGTESNLESDASSTPAGDQDGPGDAGIDDALTVSPPDPPAEATDSEPEADAQPEPKPDVEAEATAEVEAEATVDLEVGATDDLEAEAAADLEAEATAEPVESPSTPGPLEADTNTPDSESGPVTSPEAEDSSSEAAGTDSRSSSESEGSAEQPSDPTVSESDATDVAADDDLSKDEP